MGSLLKPKVVGVVRVVPIKILLPGWEGGYLKQTVVGVVRVVVIQI